MEILITAFPARVKALSSVEEFASAPPVLLVVSLAAFRSSFRSKSSRVC